MSEVPRGRIDPDRSKGWVRRLLPLLRAHSGLVAISLVAALLSQVLLVAAPRVVMAAIDTALVRKVEPLDGLVVALLVLAVARLAVDVAYRSFLFRTSACLEYDLRALVHDHLSRQSFSW